MSDLLRHPTFPLRSFGGHSGALLLLGAMLALGGCASQEYRPRYEQPVVYPTRELPSPQVYFYPAAGQSSAQQDRDRYECHMWAVKQTGFDPGSLRSQRPQRSLQVESVAVPMVESAPGNNTAVGAFTGAMVGAAVSSPRHSGEGLLLGALAGAMIGAVSDAERQDRAEAAQQYYVQQRYAQRDARYDSRYNVRQEREILSYRRAMSACLVGRNYEVQ